MPHDLNGNLLSIGDAVQIRGTVTDIYPIEDFCNLIVRLDEPMPPDRQVTYISSINSKQVEKIGDSPTTD